MPIDALRRIVAGQSLSRADARETLDSVMEGNATPAQIGGLIVALRMKGETVDEVAGFVDAMRSRVVPVRPSAAPLLDTCGTGGSAFRLFNVSTAAAFVAAAAGAAVAKHGNRAMSGTCGSADVLEALGVRVTLSPEECARCIDEVGIAFLFAPQHHPAMKLVSVPRRELGIRSIFNLLGPLTNPAGAERQVMGVYDGALVAIAAGALRALGSERAIVAHGEPGMDEISTIGATRIAELRDNEIRVYTLTRSDLGLDSALPEPDALSPARTAEENALLLSEALSGESGDVATEARREIVAVNAAAALRVFGICESWPDSVAEARRIIASGDALNLVDRLAAFTRLAA